jgi:glycosyltransferase involved in cell wall biosynthesis
MLRGLKIMPDAAQGRETERLDIAFLLRSLQGGGAERQTVLLAQGLSRRGHRVRVLTFYNEPDKGGGLRAAGVEITPLEKSGRWDVVGFLLRLARALARLRPAIVYSVLTVPNVMSACLRPLLPRHASVWGLRASNMRMENYDRLARMASALEQKLSHVPDLLIANAEAGKKAAVARGFPASKIAVIRNGIDTDLFKPAGAQEKAAARALFAIPREARVIGMVARLDPMKDHETFLRAFARAAGGRHDLLALIAGPAPDEAEGLKARAAALGCAENVRWAGHMADVTRLYAAFDCLCLPSAYGEGFSNVLGEAMAAGMPCVATDVGDAAEILGELGILVPPGDPEALAQALLAMLARIEQGKVDAVALRQRMVERFSATRMIEETERALAKLQAERRL